MQFITKDSFSCKFFVETKHGSLLEFVLKDKEEKLHNKRKSPRKNNGQYAYVPGYSEILDDMLDKAFSKTNSRITDSCEYGNLSFTITSDSLQDLEKALKVCDSVVKCWINKFKINSF